METAVITNIQKYSVHDGPGIRNTVFFKGCPLSCWWCHNPETQALKKEMMYSEDKCTGCGMCMDACPKKAISKNENKVKTDSFLCDACGKCEDYCLPCARTVMGKEYTVSQLLKELEKDRMFYEQSGGGVTLSGGEPLLQIDFVEKLVGKLDEKGISVVIDTCGQVPYESFERINEKVQMYLFDLKHVDPEKHLLYMGVDNTLILENLKRLSADGANIHLRIPLIDGVNADEVSVEAFLQTARSIHVAKVSLLPYHDIGKDKYRRLGRAYEEERMKTPSDEKMEEIKKKFKDHGFDVKIGG